AQASLESRGMAAFKTEMRDLVDPVEVGKKTSYLLKITNQGTAPAGGIEVKAFVPKEMKFVGSKAPVAEQVNGPVITFAKVDNLEPGKTVEYFVEVEALQPGVALFRFVISARSQE